MELTLSMTYNNIEVLKKYPYDSTMSSEMLIQIGIKYEIIKDYINMKKS